MKHSLSKLSTAIGLLCASAFFGCASAAENQDVEKSEAQLESVEIQRNISDCGTDRPKLVLEYGHKRKQGDSNNLKIALENAEVTPKLESKIAALRGAVRITSAGCLTKGQKTSHFLDVTWPLNSERKAYLASSREPVKVTSVIISFHDQRPFGWFETDLFDVGGINDNGLLYSEPGVKPIDVVHDISDDVGFFQENTKLNIRRVDSK